MSGLPLNARINLGRAVVLLLDDNNESLGVLVQIITAFGVKHFHRAVTVEEAKEIAGQCQLDLILTATNLRAGSGYEFVDWLRRAKGTPNMFTPCILLSGHVCARHVRLARDCGSNFIVSRPVSPSVLLERIVWIARENRPFVGCDSYFGPDRRFKIRDGDEEGPRRRREDSDATSATPSVAQDESQPEPKRAS